jgi:sulfatase maturation enzyme AslB (radical SAM superfamily)
MRSSFSSEFLDVGLHDRWIRDILLGYGHQKYWSLTGGEPTLHPDLDQILQSYSRYNIHSLTIMTNGQLDQGVKKIIENKHCVNFIRLSIDGPNKFINDAIRGVGSFDKAIESCKEYKNSGLRVGFGITLHDENIDDLENYFELALSLKVSINIWDLQKWVEPNTGENRIKSLQSEKDITWSADTYKKFLNKKQDLIKKYTKLFPENSIGISDKFAFKNPEREWVCENFSSDPRWAKSPPFRLVLLPDGQVSICCDIYDVNYNIHKYNSNIYFEEPLNDIVGDFKTQSIQTIIVSKTKQFEELNRRRKRDMDSGVLINGRENICTNCAYYHYQPNNLTKQIPIAIN